MSRRIQTPSAPSIGVPLPWLRPLLLCILFLCAIGTTIVLMLHYTPADTYPASFVQFWLLDFVPYLAACAVIWRMRAPQGRWRWIELAIILLGAVTLRALVLPLPPNLSHDSWRYLWDARITLHGYSPYVYAPGDPRLSFLRDFIYDNSRFRNVPTIYPPGAQAVYLLSYLLAPSNLFFFKGILVLCELVTSAMLAQLLIRKGLDPARSLLYAWCPLPIIEFALQGHLDALTVMLIVLIFFCTTGEKRSVRILTGFLIAFATLTKVYPILLLVVVMRRRDFALLITCFSIIILAYIPYLILGHGQVFGFFSTYASEHTPNAGVMPQIIEWLGTHLGWSNKLTLIIEYGTDLLLVGAASLLVLRLRWREQISMEAAALIVFGIIFAVSSHIFPWYTPALLPSLALLLGPIWTRHKGLREPAFAAFVLWYFTCITLISYLFTRNWSLYYLVVYDVTLVGLGVAAGAALWLHYRTTKQKG